MRIPIVTEFCLNRCKCILGNTQRCNDIRVLHILGGAYYYSVVYGNNIIQNESVNKPEYFFWRFCHNFSVRLLKSILKLAFVTKNLVLK